MTMVNFFLHLCDLCVKFDSCTTLLTFLFGHSSFQTEGSLFVTLVNPARHVMYLTSVWRRVRHDVGNFVNEHRPRCFQGGWLCQCGSDHSWLQFGPIKVAPDVPFQCGTVVTILSLDMAEAHRRGEVNTWRPPPPPPPIGCVRPTTVVPASMIS